MVVLAGLLGLDLPLSCGAAVIFLWPSCVEGLALAEGFSESDFGSQPPMTV